MHDEDVRERVMFDQIITADWKEKSNSGFDDRGSLIFGVEFDFNEVTYITDMYTMFDVLARLGGLYTAFRWLFMLVFPFLMIHYLY